MEAIENQQWFLGKMTGAAAATIIMSSAEANTFLVYRDIDRDALMFAMRVESNSSKDNVSHVEIQCQDGSYNVTGQVERFCDVVKAVNTFAATRYPPLCSAFSLEPSLSNSIPIAPPSYSQAQRALKPYLTPLPRIPDLQREDTPLEPCTSSAYSNIPFNRATPTYADDRPNHLLHCVVTCFFPCYLVVWFWLCCVYGC